MTQQSLLRDVLARCRAAQFTGNLFVRSSDGVGQIQVIAGVVDESRVGSTEGDAAIAKMEGFPTATIEVQQALPPAAKGSDVPHPSEGKLADRSPIDLFRYAEEFALTCTLELRSGGVRGEAKYILGDLRSVSCGGDTADSAVTQMLKWNDGTFSFDMPVVDVPAGVSFVAFKGKAAAAPAAAAPPADAVKKAADEAAAKKAAEEVAKAAAAAKAAEEAAAKKAADEAAKKAAEAAAAKKAADEAAAKKAADEAAKKRAEEERKKADDAKRHAEEERKKADEAKRRAEEERRRADDAKKLAEEEAARRAAEDAAAVARLEQEAAQRRVEEEAKAKRAAEEAEAKRAADEAAAKKAADEAAAKKAADEAAAKKVADEAAKKAAPAPTKPDDEERRAITKAPMPALDQAGEKKSMAPIIVGVVVVIAVIVLAVMFMGKK